VNPTTHGRLSTLLNEPRLRVLSTVNALEFREAERLRAHPDDMHVERTGAILRRTYAVLVPQQRGAQVAPQLFVAHLLGRRSPTSQGRFTTSRKVDSPVVAKQANGETSVGTV
jgi:hypothetical protein